jgi:protein-disulfide isomerase
VAFCDTASTQQKQSDDLRSTVEQLRIEVKQLKESQEHVLGQLEEFKKILSVSTEAPPTVKPPEKMSTAGERFKGASTASVVIIEYGDFGCNFCSKFELETLPKIEDNYIKSGKVRYFFRDLITHPDSVTAARAARCAGEQGKFWEMHTNLFANQSALPESAILENVKPIGLNVKALSQCLASGQYDAEINRSTEEARHMGIVGTPTFLFGTIAKNSDTITIKHTFIGAYPYEFFRTELDDLLSK